MEIEDKKKIIIKNFSDLKTIYQFPRLYFGNFFVDLKAQVDYYYVDKLNKSKENSLELQQQWKEIISEIESFENEQFKKISANFCYCQNFSSDFEQKMKSIELQIENLNEPHLETLELMKESIEKEENNLKSYLFMDKTIYFDLGEPKCLTIIDDAYLSFEKIISMKSNLMGIVLTYENLKQILFKNKTAKQPAQRVDNEQNLEIRNRMQAALQRLEFLDRFNQYINGNEARDEARNEAKDEDKTPINTKDYFKKFSLGINYMTEIFLNNSKLYSIEDFVFKELKYLKILNLASNTISKINENTFQGLTNLLELNLNQNYIDEIYGDVFKCLTSLLTLRLSYNNLKTIKENTFDGLINLKDLDLANNMIDSFENNAFNSLVNLKNLDLSDNYIKYIKSNFGRNLRFLEVLNLKNNGIRDLAENSISEMINLKKFVLSFNKLEKINPENLSGLVNLKILEISNNEITKFSVNNFKGLKKLEIIDIHNNPIKEIDSKAFEELANLKEIRLDLKEKSNKEEILKHFSSEIKSLIH